MRYSEQPSGADFELLRKLVESKIPEGHWLAAETAEEAKRMQSLARLGLVEIEDAPPLDPLCRPTMKGRDLVADADARARLAEAETKRQFQHDFRVAAFGAVAGGVLGFFSGGLGGWLFTEAIPAALKSLGI